MTRAPRGPEPPPLYGACVAAHRVDRFDVGELDIKIPAVSVDHARRLVVAEAYRRAGGLPPWKPLVRTSLKYATAKQLELAS